MEQTLKRTLLILLLALMALPAMLHIVGITPDAKLNGVFTYAGAPAFADSSWFSGSYQRDAEYYLNTHFKFRNFVIRLHHQLAYSIYNKTGQKNIIMGKEGYLYEYQYIDAYFGDDYLGEDSIKRQVANIKHLQDLLWAQRRLLVVVYAPGKAAYYPEYIPDQLVRPKKTTNVETFVKYSKDLGLNHIDMHSWFVKLHDSHPPYKLFPKYGTHWSRFGALVALDSIQGYLARATNIPLPRIRWEKPQVSNEAVDTDKDLGDCLNLLFPLPPDELAYLTPKYSLPPNTLVNAAFIGDSFFWTLYNQNYFKDVFPNGQFWYYNKEIWPVIKTNPNATIDKTPLANLLADRNVYVIVCTDANLNKIGWGFIEKAIATLDLSR